MCDPNDSEEIRKLLQLLKLRIDNMDENKETYEFLGGELIKRCPKLEFVHAEVVKSHEEPANMLNAESNEVYVAPTTSNEALQRPGRLPETEPMPEAERVPEPEPMPVIELGLVHSIGGTSKADPLLSSTSVYPEAKRRCAR